MKKYKRLLFDLDNTLVDDDENRKYAIKKILLERNERVDDKILNKFIILDNKFWEDRASGKIKDPYEFKNNDEKSDWVRAQRFIMFFGVTLEEGININNRYINYLREKVIPISNANEVLKYLYDMDYEIYIITNSPIKVVDNKLIKSKLKEYVSGVFTAEEVGYMKPHEVFFRNVFDKLGEDRNSMLVIGDNIYQDIAGAIYNNIDSCWFNNKKNKNNTDFIPSYEINDLIELKNIL